MTLNRFADPPKNWTFSANLAFSPFPNKQEERPPDGWSFGKIIMKKEKVLGVQAKYP